MALTTTAATKTFLGVSGTGLDSFLDQVRPAVERAFLNLIDREIESNTYTQYLTGRGRPVLVLPEYPVASVASVYHDLDGYYGQGENAFASSTLLVAGTDYALIKDGQSGNAQTGKLVKIGGVWPGRWQRVGTLITPMLRPSFGSVKVTYTAGFATVPADIPLAIWQVCAQMVARRSTGYPLSAERFEDYSYTSLVDEATSVWDVGTVAGVVARYRRITPRYEVLS